MERNNEKRTIVFEIVGEAEVKQEPDCKTNIDRLIIFGDSMSDIGRKKDSGFGKIARMSNKMRVNKVGRFSDNRNWTDFIWEWSGGEPMIQNNEKISLDRTKKHLSLLESSENKDDPYYYCNYATGGATGDSDKLSLKIGLTTFKEQVNLFLREIAGQKNNQSQIPNSNAKRSNTLFIIWFGLNDIVTVKRKKDIGSVASEMFTLCTEIKTKTANFINPYFMIITNPDPKEAVRYFGENLEAEVFSKLNQELNNAIEKQFQTLENTKIVRLDKYMVEASRTFSKNGIIIGSQPHGKKVRYVASPETEQKLLSNGLNGLIKSIGVYPNEDKHNKEIEHIKDLITSAIKDSNEIILYQEMKEFVLKKEDKSSKLWQGIVSCLKDYGTFIECLDFTLDYYKTQYPGKVEKHQENIQKIKESYKEIYKKNVLEVLREDLEREMRDIYETIEEVLNKLPDNSTLRKALTECILKHFQFTATSDKAHPTEAVHRIIAFFIACEIVEVCNLGSLESAIIELMDL